METCRNIAEKNKEMKKKKKKAAPKIWLNQSQMDYMDLTSRNELQEYYISSCIVSNCTFKKTLNYSLLKNKK